MPAALSPRAFQRSLADRAFAPVYLIHGEDDYLKDVAVQQLVGAVVDPGVRDFNLELRRGADLDAETLGALLGTPPLMAERRLVVVRDVGALKKDARKELDRYLARPAIDTVVALVATSGSKTDAKLVDHANVTPVVYRQLRGDEVNKWIAHHVDTQLEGSITPEAASLLHSAVGADLAALASELDKLLSYTNGEEIDEVAVTEIVGVRRGETLGDFLDAVGDRDARRALHIMPHVMQQPKTTGVTVVMALAMHMSALAWAQAAHAEGFSAKKVEGEFFNFLKESGGFAGRAWGDAVRTYSRQYRKWSASDLDAALDTLLEADASFKTSKVSTEIQLMTNVVLALCVRRGV